MNYTKQTYIERHEKKQTIIFITLYYLIVKLFVYSGAAIAQLPSPIRRIVGSVGFGDCMSQNKIDHTTNGIKHRQPIA